ncbi:MAG: DUF3617 family protein [Deltaproteobacteria bacterium]|jgi:hypothetical protein|nr:DUF3617 family protein [Deltaproteobacteria bacterium]
MNKKIRFIFLVLTVIAFIPVLSGCKGGSTSSSSASSSAVKTPATINKLSPGLWKMKMHTDIKMPSIAGRPAIDHSAVTVMKECIKPDSKQTKSYMMKPKNFQCSHVGEHIDMDGTIHWSMQCKGPNMTLASKGRTKISSDSFTSHATATQTSLQSGFTVKSTIDTVGKRLSSKCPAKS